MAQCGGSDGGTYRERAFLPCVGDNKTGRLIQDKPRRLKQPRGCEARTAPVVALIGKGRRQLVPACGKAAGWQEVRETAFAAIEQGARHGVRAEEGAGSGINRARGGTTYRSFDLLCRGVLAAGDWKLRLPNIVAVDVVVPALLIKLSSAEGAHSPLIVSDRNGE